MRTVFLFVIPFTWLLGGCAGSVDHYFSHKDGLPAATVHAGEVGWDGLNARPEHVRAADVASQYTLADVGIEAAADDGEEACSGVACHCPVNWTAKTVEADVLLLEGAHTALRGQGNAKLAIDGNLLVNSDSQAAIALNGNAVVSASEIYMAGFSSIVGHALLIANKIHGGMQPAADPLKFMAPPSPARQRVRSITTLEIHDQSVTLQPGLYFGGVYVSGGSEVNLLPGTYFFMSGGLNISDNAHVAGTEVTLYMADGAAEPINIGGNGSLNVTPPTSGTMKGITFFVNRDNASDFTLNGNACLKIHGTIYAAGSEVHLTGNGNMLAASQIISRNLRVSGNGSSNITAVTSKGVVAKPIGCFQ